MNTKLRAGIALLLTFVVVAMIVPLVVVAGGPSDRVPDHVHEQLPPGWERIAPNVAQRLIGIDRGKGPFNEDMAVYEAVISSLPTTLPDNETLIDTQWHQLIDVSGQTWYESGANLFKARVLDGRISVEDEYGRLIIWDSRIVIGDTFEGGTAAIVDDPLGANYESNTLSWTYGPYPTGAGEGATITRYLRTVEGIISELWYIPEKPNTSILLDITRSTEPDYTGEVVWILAWDSAGRVIPVTTNTLGWFVLGVDDLAGLTYPLWIDPTVSFTGTSANDAWFVKLAVVYADAHDATTGSIYHTNTGYIGQCYYPAYNDYSIDRFVVAWDTSSLPDTAVVLSPSYLRLYGVAPDKSATDFSITVQSGGTTYPHVPPVSGDYNQANYSGNGGSLSTSGFVTGQYNRIDLNTTGYGWVSRTGWTRFMLRSSRDISGTPPTGDELVYIRQAEAGSSYAPILFLTYAVAVVRPTVTTLPVDVKAETTLTLRGLLDDDGGESCSTRFLYGYTSSLIYSTSWVSGYVTDDIFSYALVGIDPGALVYYKAQAQNSAGASVNTDTTTVLTHPYRPDSFVVTVGDTQVGLTWTKGAGATNTIIRRSSTGYPATPTSDTSVYSGTGASETDTGLVNGTTYYYAAWGYISSGGLTEHSLLRTTWTATPEAPALATVVTYAATSVGATTANLNLALTSMGGYGSVDISFEYGLTDAYGSTTTPVTATSTGTLTEPISGLATTETYHFRARAQNVAGWAYGADMTFVTGGLSAPTITTDAADGEQLSSAQLHGTVTSDGDAPPVTVWFEYGLTTEYEMGKSPTVGGLETGSTFYFGLTGLASDTEYHFRAVGENSEGEGWGEDDTFTTDAPSAPTAETLTVASFGSRQATLRGQVLTDGGVTVEVSFEYGLNVSYGKTTPWVGGYSQGQMFEALITGLEIDTEYHFRARARNDGGTGNGDDGSFTTVFVAPTGFSAISISYASINLKWTRQGDQAYIRYKSSGYPVDRADGDPAYFGTGESTTVSGLEAGVTYYFKAWSWSEGGVWSTTTAAAVSTTLPTMIVGEEHVPQDIVGDPDAPGNWFTDPNQDKLALLPGYGILTNIADAYEMPYGTFFFFIGMAGVVGAGALGYLITKKEVVAILVGGLAVGALASFGFFPGYLVLIYIAIAGGITYLLSRRGEI